MKTIDIVKTVSDFVVTAGVGTIIGGILNTTVDKDMDNLKKLSVAITTIVISSAVSEKVRDYARDQIDEMAMWIKQAKREHKKEDYLGKREIKERLEKLNQLNDTMAEAIWNKVENKEAK